MFLNMLRFSESLISDGREFHILGPRLLKLLVPYCLVLWALTISKFLEACLLVFRVNISFVKLGFKLFIGPRLKTEGAVI